jgi:hypothetical protein
MEVTMTNKQTKLTNHKATMIAEGAQEPDYPEQYVEAWQQPDYPEQYVEAWQHLITTGLVWKLQGWMGRCAKNLIADGTCTIPKSDSE